MINFTHLNLHTEYSFIDGIIKISQIVSIFKDKYKSVCATDILTVISFYEYYYFCYDNELKPLIGTECYILFNGNIVSIILIAKNLQGYININNILSNAWRYGNIENGVFIKLHWIKKYSDNIIIILNIRYFLLNEMGFIEKEFFFFIKNIIFIFEKNLYFEINRINLPFEYYVNNKIIYFSKKFKINLVATNSVKFLFFADYSSSIGKILLNQEDLKNNEIFFEYTDQQYLKDYFQIKNIFFDVKNAIKNISNIINDCNLNFKCYNFILPSIKIKKKNIRKKIFNFLIKKGLRFRILKKKKNIFPYLNRINKEIILVKNMYLIDYFLIIFEFIFWSKKKKIPSGPGRGSGASSLLCYSLYITDIDPVNENLLFERFLTTERHNLPDLDLDFCVLERDSLIEHIFNYYNYRNTSQIITFHDLSTKSLIRDLSRAIGMDYISGDRFSKCIPFSLELSMEQMFRKYLSIRSYISSNEKSLDIWKIATKIEGTNSKISKHAGGVVISKHCLFNTTPILFDDENCITQYEKNILQELGLLKFDFLGLKTITIINFTIDMIPENSVGEFNIDDFQTYEMINNLNTDLVFQLESNGMKKMIKRSPIGNIFDIIFFLSLFRPGPIHSGCVNIFLNRKNNLEKTYFPYKENNFLILKIFISYTHGVILFQEQIILIIQTFFECTPYDSEKIFQIMISNEEDKIYFLYFIFEKKCFKLNLKKKVLKKFFFLIVVFAGYSFNRTHAHSYAKIVYQTAFLKANYLLEYCLSNIYVDQLLGIDLDRIIFNLKSIGVIFYKPDINLSDENFKIYKHGIIYGFSIVKYIDEFFIDKIIFYRNKIFFYNNFEIFCKIFSIFKIKNKSIIENLIFCGFFDCFRINRIILFVNFQFFYQKIISLLDEYNRTILYKFINYIDYSLIPNLKIKQFFVLGIDILNIEKKLLKFYVSNNPTDFYSNILIGIKNYNFLYRLEYIEINVILAVPKKKMFFEKKVNFYRLFNSNKTYNLSVYSKYVLVPNLEIPFIYILNYNKEKNTNKIIKFYDTENFLNSIGGFILIKIKNIFFFFKILNFLFNIFSLTGFLVYIKYKQLLLNTKICIKINEKNMIKLKILRIFNLSVYYLNEEYFFN